MDWVPLLSALAGALIVSATTIVTIVLQSGREERQHLRETAASLALAEYHSHVDLAKAASAAGRGPQPLAPIATYFVHQLSLLKAAAKGDLSGEDLVRLQQESREATQALKDAQDGH